MHWTRLLTRADGSALVGAPLIVVEDMGHEMLGIPPAVWPVLRIAGWGVGARGMAQIKDTKFSTEIGEACGLNCAGAPALRAGPGGHQGCRRRRRPAGRKEMKRRAACLPLLCMLESQG